MDLDPNVSCPRIVRLKKDTSPPRISSSQQETKKERKKALLESFRGLQGGMDRLFSTLSKARVLACCSQRQASPIFIFI
jgi:hypothetical protein